MPEACLFDLDGLLIDSEPLHGKAWSQAAASLGARLNEEQLIKLRGRRRIECADQIAEWIGGSLNSKELLSAQRPIAKNLLSQAKAMPGAQELIQWCSNKRIPIALVTSSSSDSVAYKTAPHKWLNLIKTRVLGDDPFLKLGKPAPDPFIAAAKRLKVSPQNCWALEDSLAGTKSALAAQCQVWVLEKDKKYTDLDLKVPLPNPVRINKLNVVLEAIKILKEADQSI